MTLFWKDLKDKVDTSLVSKIQEEDSDSEAEAENGGAEDPEKVSSLKRTHENKADDELLYKLQDKAKTQIWKKKHDPDGLIDKKKPDE
jgi:hypothetical protein